MGNSVPAIVGIFAIAGMTIVCAACDKDNPFEKALTVLNGGVPVPGGPAAPASFVAPVEVAMVVSEPVECVVPAALFRSMQCDEVTGQLIPIR